MPHNKNGYKWCRVDLRWAIYALHNYRCVWCNRPWSAETLDHLVPFRYGAKYHNRMVPACRECNEGRRRLTVRVWIAGRTEEERRRIVAAIRLQATTRFTPAMRKAALVARAEILSGKDPSDDSDIPF